MKFIIILLSSMITTLGYGEDLTPSLIKEDENGFSYYSTPVNNGAFMMSFQLAGSFELVGLEDDLIIFVFSGTVNQMISGNQAFYHGGDAIQLKYETVNLPVRVRRWSDAESKTWGPSLMTFTDAQDAFAKNKKYKLKVALKSPEYTFFDNGDLLAIETPQFHYETIEPDGSGQRR